MQDVAMFAEKVYARKDLQGFQGDARFVRNENAQKMFSKWRASIGGIYAWRIQNPKSSADQKRMLKEADFVFRQAFALCPSSPEALYRYVNILVQDGRPDDGIRIGEAAQKVSPENKQLDQLLIELRRIKATLRK